jgi:hypothetical protein
MIAAVSTGDTGLTLPAVIAIVSVVVAVLGVSLAPFWRALGRTQAATEDAVRRCDEQVTVSAMALRSQALGLRAISNTFEASIGVLHRALEGRTDEVPTRAVVEQLHAMKLGVERAAAEATLLSTVDLAQRTALQQLVHRVGDQDTVKLFAAASSCEQLGSLTGAELARASAQLEARLGVP